MNKDLLNIEMDNLRQLCGIKHSILTFSLILLDKKIITEEEFLKYSKSAELQLCKIWGSNTTTLEEYYKNIEKQLNNIGD